MREEGSVQDKLRAEIITKQTQDSGDHTTQNIQARTRFMDNEVKNALHN